MCLSTARVTEQQAAAARRRRDVKRRGGRLVLCADRGTFAVILENRDPGDEDAA